MSNNSIKKIIYNGETVKIFWKDWPGKSPAFDGDVEHPAAYHMLDVAAVAEVLIKPFKFERKLQQALIYLVALHDIGKISDSFRSMLREDKPQHYSHWKLSEIILYHFDKFIENYLGSSQRVRQYLYSAVAGHHGRPSDLQLSFPGDGDKVRALNEIGSGLEAAWVLIKEMATLWPEASLQGIKTSQATRLSWWLPGLSTAADWIGSNKAWFQSYDQPMELAEYLERARAIAPVAVREAGLAGTSPQQVEIFSFKLRPMQKAASEVALPDGPMLAVIEDETGAGKTEAALLLAHRMTLAGKGRGLYFALPTMATADAMFIRAQDILDRMFRMPSLTLAHGRAGLSSCFKSLINDGRVGKNDSVSCTEWLYENRRRALLADIGIGTIDQALLAVLPVRFQTLRYFGLSSKILIVDEVHEMGEPYVAELLAGLLRLHREAGGSAILLTATLPLSLREKLLQTYGGQSASYDYPSLLIAGGKTVTSFEKDGRPKKGPIVVNRLNSADEAVELIRQQAAKGAACVWVRNAVDDAIEAVEQLRASGIDAHLIHARFTLYDRKNLEAEINARVGKNGRNREGFVLIGTQVLESSLDFDFDVMVSDIAPIGALIQRAGRLWRHMDIRPQHSRPVPTPHLHVLSPDPQKVDDERWLHVVLNKGAWVYSVADIWRSAKVLFDAGFIDAPSGLRALIERVYGDQAEELPQQLQAKELEFEGQFKAKQTLATHNIVDFSKGYKVAGRGFEDSKYPTRLGQETIMLVLARITPNGLMPWADLSQGADLAEAWLLSEVSVNQNKLRGLNIPDQERADIKAITKDWPEWKRKGVIVCPVEESGFICEGLCYTENLGITA